MTGREVYVRRPLARPFWVLARGGRAAGRRGGEGAAGGGDSGLEVNIIPPSLLGGE